MTTCLKFPCLVLASVVFTSCGKEKTEPPALPAKKLAIPTEASFKAESGWSKEVQDFPGFPPGTGGRVWSHHEISQRHQALLMKELPEYVTQLRGGGAMPETDGTSASWYFRVSQDKLPDWENYMKQIGVPEHALRSEVVIFPPFDANTERRKRPPVPATALVFCISMVSTGEGDIMGMKFGKSVKSVTYSLYNPNITRASIRITVAWKTGDVQILENPVRPDGE